MAKSAQTKSVQKKPTRAGSVKKSPSKKLSTDLAVVLTVYNEEHHIKDSFTNIRKLTDNIVVVDTASTDNSAQIAKDMGYTIYPYIYERYVEPSRNFAISKVTADWFFIIDADERFSPELIKEICQTIKTTTKTHFTITKKNIFAGRWPLKHGGWQGDSMIRLIKTDAFKNWPKAIHSTPKIDGECGHLKALLDHHFHPNLEDMVQKTAIYEDMESNLLHKAGRPVSVPIFFRKFFGELYRRFFKWQGFRDGTPGIIESVYQAYSKTVTYLFLYEKRFINKKTKKSTTV